MRNATKGLSDFRLIVVNMSLGIVKMYSKILEHLLFPAVEWKYGMNIREKLYELEETQWWGTAQLEEIQNERLRRLIKHAYENVPYYRRILDKKGLTPGDINNVSDLPKLPTLTRKSVRQEYKDILSLDIAQRKPKLNRTGGSTGEPLQFYIDWESWSMVWACIYFGWRLAGHNFGDKMATLAGSSLFPDKSSIVQGRIRPLMERNLTLSAVHMSDNIMREYSDLIAKHQPKFIRGYPTAIYMFADYLKKNSLAPVTPKAVFTTAEVLLPSHRELIEEVFNCKVFDGYGCADGGGSAIECSEHNGHHVPIQRVVMEVVDEQGYPVGSGQSGTIVLTDLFNYSMPFIRYEVGDSGILSDQACPCGRGLPLVKSLLGRTTEIIRFRDGTTLSGPALTLIFMHFPILQYQIVQRDLDDLLIKIVKQRNYTEEDTNRLINTMEHHVGRQGSVHLEFVQDIQPTKAGKRLFIISSVSQNL